MKKLIPLLVLVGAVASYAQNAEVNFANNNLDTNTAPRRVLFQGTTIGVTGTNLQAVLLYGTSATSLTPHTAPAPFRIPTTSQPGTWNGGVRTLNGIANTPGTPLSLQVAVFDINRHANYAAALAGGGILGQSAVFQFTIPTPPLGPTALDMGNFNGFTIVPEPSVIGLGLVGAAALFMLRRRKAS